MCSNHPKISQCAVSSPTFPTHTSGLPGTSSHILFTSSGNPRPTFQIPWTDAPTSVAPSGGCVPPLANCRPTLIGLSQSTLRRILWQGGSCRRWFQLMSPPLPLPPVSTASIPFPDIKSKSRCDERLGTCGTQTCCTGITGGKFGYPTPESQWCPAHHIILHPH